ncbi:MAG TPA: GHMP kinase [Methanocorpusculum sp.]|nr:GHMP kinase [Methanocorpusculum sp.]
MTIMKIRGGDLDLVEYDFHSFKPGENIRTDNIKSVGEVIPQKGTIHVRVPSRVHLSVLDMNRFSPDNPGGGAIGFAIQIYNETEISCTDSEIIIDSPRHLIIKHIAEAFKKATGYSGGFKISTKEMGKEHIGLGSTCTTLTAAAAAMNKAVGSPLSMDDVRNLVGYNYVEETENPDEIIFGFETGLGAMCSIYGGFNVIGDKLAKICSCTFAEDKNVFIFTPNIHDAADNAGNEEFSLLMNRARTLDYRDRELKTYMVMMDLIPALASGDLKKAGDIMWEIEFRGSKRAEVQHHSFVMYQYMNELRLLGLEFVIMSSVGPSICVVTEKSRDEIEAMTKDLDLKISESTKVDNEGIVFY